MKTHLYVMTHYNFFYNFTIILYSPKRLIFERGNTWYIIRLCVDIHILFFRALLQ